MGHAEIIRCTVCTMAERLEINTGKKLALTVNLVSKGPYHCVVGHHVERVHLSDEHVAGDVLELDEVQQGAHLSSKTRWYSPLRVFNLSYFNM